MGFKFIQPRFAAGPRRLRELKAGAIRRAAAGAIESALTNLIDERFDDRTAPTGTPWAPRKPPTGTWPILEKTGAMRRSFKVIATSAQVKVVSDSPYLQYHQTGTARMVARPVLPTGAMPPEWDRRVDAAVSNAVDRLLGS